jgi:hypothetical protein
MAVIGSQLYSFRYTNAVFGTVFQPDTPAAAALSAIEAKLTEGHADYLAGQYQPAIGAYNQAASLIYGQLHPPAIGGTGTISLTPALFTPLLSLGPPPRRPTRRRPRRRRPTRRRPMRSGCAARSWTRAATPMPPPTGSTRST